MAEFVGLYQIETGMGKYDEFLRAMDIDAESSETNPLEEQPCIGVLNYNDGFFLIKTLTGSRQTAFKIKLGEEFIQERLDGKNVKTIITQEENKLIERQYYREPVTIEYAFGGNKLFANCRCKDIVCIRSYNKQ